MSTLCFHLMTSNKKIGVFNTRGGSGGGDDGDDDDGGILVK